MGLGVWDNKHKHNHPTKLSSKQTNKQTKTEQTKRFATRLKRPTNQPDQPDPTAPTLNCKPHTNTPTHTTEGGVEVKGERVWVERVERVSKSLGFSV